MNITELIALLSAMREEYGDLQIGTGDGFYSYSHVATVEIAEAEPVAVGLGRSDEELGDKFVTFR